MRVLLSDTTWTTMTLAHTLTNQGFYLTRADSAAETIEYAQMTEQNVIVIDSDLPDMRMSDCVRRLRHIKQDVGILVIGRPGDAIGMLKAFELGADDWIAETTDPLEICARLAAISRRHAGRARPVLEVADLVIDCDTHSVTLAGAPMHLTRIEYELLEMLALNVAKVVSKEAMMGQVYALDDEPDARIIDVYICRIRRKIAAMGGHSGIVETIWGRGYMLMDTTALDVAA